MMDVLKKFLDNWYMYGGCQKKNLIYVIYEWWIIEKI